jgi:hypothetical protein
MVLSHVLESQDSGYYNAYLLQMPKLYVTLPVTYNDFNDYTYCKQSERKVGLQSSKYGSILECR